MAAGTPVDRCHMDIQRLVERAIVLDAANSRITVRDLMYRTITARPAFLLQAGVAFAV
jgi:hypothetical protein